jgi:AraC family ethanolamine operon transcriptional activator
MPFRSLRASPALSLERYADIDQFRESERYVRAESIPLSPERFCCLRASLTFPSCVLSLVRTFPRIIKGYEMPGRMVLVIPMDNVSSTRVNGAEVDDHSLILFKGSTNCTIYEPEGRLVAILAFHTELLDRTWRDFGDGHLLLRLQPFQLATVQHMVRHMLELAARAPEIIHAPDALQSMQAILFEALDVMMCSGKVHGLDRRKTLSRYKEILDRIEATVSTNPTVDPAIEGLAAATGVSVRTLQTASRSISGLGIHQYSRLRRLWSVRRQLRSGGAGLTVKASALANGFWHMGEFSSVYRTAFGESPSETLSRSRDTASEPRYAALAPS